MGGANVSTGCVSITVDGVAVGESVPRGGRGEIEDEDESVTLPLDGFRYDWLPSRLIRSCALITDNPLAMQLS